ncbi:MAG TPA: SEC-C metal-binding domain-containing protein, partial [Paenalcaligenes sp.]|nr:SEC-C metal-binding domain-containing protein [Paenalcaligenes sp.]
IYTQRNEVLESESVRDMVINLLEASMTSVFHTYIPEESMEEQWDLVGLENVLYSEYQFELPLSEMIEQDTSLTDEDLLDAVIEKAKAALSTKIEQVGEESWTPFERAILLQSIDTQWRGHLLAMDQLRQGIHLRGYAQRDPRQEYKREAFELFAEMLDRIRDEVVKVVLTVRIRPAEEAAPETPAQQTAGTGINVRYQHADYDAATGQQAANEPASAGRQRAAAGAAATAGESVPRVGRNAACPCGSGKKYKHCHGRLA